MKKIIAGFVIILLLATGSFITYDYFFAANRTLSFLPKKNIRVAIQPFAGIDNGSVQEVRKGNPEIEQGLFWKIWPWWVRVVCPVVIFLIFTQSIFG